MLSYFIHLSLRYYLYILLALRCSILMYLLHYMFHFTDYHLPLHLLQNFIHLTMSYRMCYLLLMLSHYYIMLTDAIDNSMLHPHLLLLLCILSLFIRSLVRYSLLLLLVLRLSMSLYCFMLLLLHSHLHILHRSHMFLALSMSYRMSLDFMMLHFHLLSSYSSLRYYIHSTSTFILMYLFT